MAAAAMVAAAAFPSVVEAEEEKSSVVTQRNKDKNQIINHLQSQFKKLDAESRAKNDEYLLETSWKASAKIVRNILGIKALDKQNEELRGISERIAEMLEVASEGKDGKPLTHVDWLSVDDLQKIKLGADEILRTEGVERAGEIEKLTAFLSRATREAQIAGEVQPIWEKLVSVREQLKTLSNAEGASLNELINRYELTAETDNGTVKPVGSWGADNLNGAYADILKENGQTLIGDQTIVEITQRSGEASNPLAGTTGGQRYVGTLRVSEEADHRLDVKSGHLVVTQGIEGAGKLSIAVGTEGRLRFEEGGQGIRFGANGVEITAGHDAGMSEFGGTVQFDAGTSAGSAKLDIRDGGSLWFEEGANAGTSRISISNGGAATFIGAQARQSSIANSGNVHLVLSSGGNAEINNDSDGEVLFSLSKLEKLRLSNSGHADFWATSGGDAVIDNKVAGTVAFDDASLESLTLDNAGVVSISDALGGNATITNRASGEVAIFDTALENIRLSNEGRIGLIGKTTADNAIVTMSGGTLDVRYVGDANDDSAAQTAPAEKAITIGSLSGTGEVITGTTTVTLGSANRDDEFGGRFVQTRDDMGVTVEDWLTIQTPEPLELRMSAEAGATQGVQLIKVGTGNLTLSGDQGDVSSLGIQAGTLTAAHANALGSGTVSVASAGTVALNADVAGVTTLSNAGTLDLGTNKLAVGKYESSEGAKINSRVAKQGDDLAFGAIQVSEDSDFRTTKIAVAVDEGIEVDDLLK
ncbi:hypothetical protein, partial [Pandoraea sp.]|uniref:hypothetical protein n=1 Tax=Pandoraea sp. TaxID=1883445 RepID=UPI0035B12260